MRGQRKNWDKREGTEEELGQNRGDRGRIGTKARGRRKRNVLALQTLYPKKQGERVW